MEKLFYDENTSVRFNTIKRLETELKWIKLMQSASPLGFNDNIYQEGNISKMPDFIETELKWIKLLQSASPLGFNDNICQERNISKMPDFDVFSLLEIRKRKPFFAISDFNVFNFTRSSSMDMDSALIIKSSA